MSGDAWVVSISGRIDQSVVSRLMNTWQQRRLIDYGNYDYQVVPNSVPDDTLFDEQWQLSRDTEQFAALNVLPAWEITRGSASVIVAVVDTGVRFEHPDLSGRLLPGYDFVSAVNAFSTFNRVPEHLDFVKAHDGDGRDTDATDPGDGVDELTHSVMQQHDIDCPLQNSSWHGTAMASLIAANGNDGQGMTGVDHRAMILPVRAIGRCGGRRSDLLDAIRWAAGVDDPALPVNPTPARVINLSLGIDDACSRSDQAAINDAVAAGAIVVAAVGNLARDLDLAPSSPSHCQNVIGITAVDSYGQRASYSNFGIDADLAAPGGETHASDDRPVLIATNTGLQQAQANGSSYRFSTGTSIAAPMVSGIVSLMLSVNPSLTSAEVTAILKTTSRPFPTADQAARNGAGTDNVTCDLTSCGSGLVDAYAAVSAALNFDRENPGELLARAILDDQPVFISGSGGGAGWITPWLLMALLLTNLRHMLQRVRWQRRQRSLT